MRKAIPIGYEDFKEIIDKNLYYVDKTRMIGELSDRGGKVNLFTRPRRFGKTLNLSMLRRFFEDERTAEGEKVDNGYLFDGLAIAAAGEKYVSMQQQYPVISLSLKSAKQPDFDMAYASLVDEISGEFARHEYVLDRIASEVEREQFLRIREKRAAQIEYAKSLEFLSRCLSGYHGKNTVILIDEYDVPLEDAYFRGFYDPMIDFIRSLFESALKTNPALEFGVITGCLRISKESIFTGLNNLEIHSVLGPYYCDSFGFTEEEVTALLDYYGLAEKYPQLRDWYDGYRFGEREIYNPWSVLNYTKTALGSRDAFPKPYWANTSSNGIIREMVEEADAGVREEMERLIKGETIEKPVHEDITYADIHQSEDNLWNFLFFTGYLKKCGERQEGEQIYMEMTIPNREIKSIYKNTVLEWFGQKVKKSDLSGLFNAVIHGDDDAFGELVSDQLQQTISFFDYKETYYHGFLTGLLSAMPGYSIVSNRESGKGRPDLVLREQKFRGRGIIMELKVTDSFPEMENLCRRALEQIEENHYAEALEADGCREIIKYGICFFKKGCLVMSFAE